MKTARFILWLLLATSFSLAQSIPPDGEAPAVPASVPAPAPAEPSLRPELNALREQLDAIRRSNEAASEKWDTLAAENSALSNRVADLQQALLTQKDRELELARQSHAFNMKLLGGAALGVVLVVLLSYWFQMRCFNRVIEVTRSLPPYHSPALLEQENAANSKLLGAIQLLETRIQQLELPQPSAPNSVPTTELPAPAPEPHSALPQNAVEPEPPRPASAATPKLVAGNDRNEPKAPGVQPSTSSMAMARGQALLDLDRLQEAADCFQEAIALDPQNAEAHFKKGIACERMKQLEPALAAYEETLRLNPKRSAAQVYRARVLQGLHRYDEALSVYDSALAKPAPNHGSTTLAS